MSTHLTKTTKNNKILSNVFCILSLSVTFIPVILYVVKGFITGDIGEKWTMGMLLTVALLLTIINTIFKFHIRCTIWILILGIYICLDNILPLIIILAIGTILDEMLFTPLYKSYKNKYKINKEIDKRI